MPPSTDEKLLTGTEAEKFLPSGSGENYPMQSAKEFLTRTPEHELKNVFGMAAEEKLESRIPLDTTETEHQKFEIPIPKERPRLSMLRFLGGFLLVMLILIIVLYIWGGMLAR